MSTSNSDTRRVSAHASDAPDSFSNLSKKCQRVLQLAMQQGRFKPRSNTMNHFQALVRWGFLTDDGVPTDKGRELYNGGQSTKNSRN